MSLCAKSINIVNGNKLDMYANFYDFNTPVLTVKYYSQNMYAGGRQLVWLPQAFFKFGK